MVIDKLIPYQNLPPLPPKITIETPKVLKKAIRANAMISRLDEASATIPNPRVLINTIPLLEAQASSAIENIVTTHDELFRAANDINFHQTPATQEALRYRYALQAGWDAIRNRPLTTNTALIVCSAIRGFDVGIREGTGTYIGNPNTKERVYTPPEGKDVIRHHLKEWENFLHNDDQLDPLVKLALLHYQFEAIHPFTDGNGRTGRIINVLYLVEKKILRLPITYLSGFLVRNKDKYYQLLSEVTNLGNWEEWIMFILEGIEITSEWTLNMVNHIKILQDATVNELKNCKPKLPASHLTELLFTQPYLRYKNVIDSCQVSRPTAMAWMDQLEQLGIVSQARVGKTNVFINTQFLKILFDSEFPQ